MKSQESLGKLVISNWSIIFKPQKETEPGIGKGKLYLLACHTHCKCSIMETTCYSVKVKLGIKVIKLVKRLIG